MGPRMGPRTSPSLLEVRTTRSGSSWTTVRDGGDGARSAGFSPPRLPRPLVTGTSTCSCAARTTRFGKSRGPAPGPEATAASRRGVVRLYGALGRSRHSRSALRAEVTPKLLPRHGTDGRGCNLRMKRISADGRTVSITACGRWRSIGGIKAPLARAPAPRLKTLGGEESRARRHLAIGRDEAHRPQDRGRVPALRDRR